MNINFGSVCSGIEAASCAWLPLGWKSQWLSEIEPFPSAVLAYRHPDTPNLGDMTKIAARITAGEIPAPDVLVGGTPCQAFSIAGLRGGMEDARGALTLKYVELANAIDNKRTAAGHQPAIAVWENVPGVLSSHDNAFGCFLAGLAGEDEAFEPGDRPESGKSNPFWRWDAKTGCHIPKWPQCGCVYGPQRKMAWRVLDAQYFGVAQRRRRIFVVASARTDIDPVQILLEFDGVRRDIAPSREKREITSALTANGVGVRGADDNQAQAGHLIAVMAHGQAGAEIRIDNASPTLTCNHEAPIVMAFQPGNCTRGAGSSPSENVFPTLKADHGRGMSDQFPHLAIIAFPKNMSGTQCAATEGIAPALMATNPTAIAFSSKDHGQDAAIELSPTIRSGGHSGSHANAGAPPAVAFCLQHAQIGRKDSAGPQGKGWQKEVGFTLDSRCCADAVVYGIPGNWTGRTPGNGGNAIEPMNDISPCLTHTDRHDVASCAIQSAVRRLTPIECERLQGFPDNWTLIPTDKRKKVTEDELAYLRQYYPDISDEDARLLAADGPRYKALGNSMAVPVMRWIGERIASAITASRPAQPQKVTHLRHAREPIEFERPIFKWAGGKFSVLPVLSEHLPHGKRLIEPFVGGGSVFTNAGYSQCLLNDVNADLINAYRVLKYEGHALITLAHRYFHDYNDADSFLSIRKAFNAREYDDINRAAAFLYLNRHGFNGLIRYNLKGEFNVGFGKYKKPYFPHEEMEAFLGAADRCEFVCGDFGGVIEAAGEDDVIFCDPPYEPLPDTNGFTSYSGHSFAFDEQVRLVSLLVAACKRGAKVVITNSGAPNIRDLYESKGFTIHDMEARRSVSCKGETRAMANDIIATLGC